MDPESTATSAFAKVCGKLLGGLNIGKLANARMGRHARLLEDRTTKEINADAATSDFDLATTDVRTKLKLAFGDAAVAAIDKDNPIALRGLGRIWEYAEREQWNVEKTLEYAAAALSEDEPGSEPSDEWLHHFQDGAKFMSDEDLRSLWGSILAQEIRQPGTVSKRTLGVLKTIDKRTAVAFQRIRSLAFGFWDPKLGAQYGVPVVKDGESDEVRLNADMHTLELMNADGLLISAQSAQVVTLTGWGQVAEYQGKPWCLKPVGAKEAKPDDNIHIPCSPMGVTGNEIARVINITRNKEHEYKLINYLASKGLTMVPLPGDCKLGQPIPTKYHRYVLEY